MYIYIPHIPHHIAYFTSSLQQGTKCQDWWVRVPKINCCPLQFWRGIACLCRGCRYYCYTFTRVSVHHASTSGRLLWQTLSCLPCNHIQWSHPCITPAIVNFMIPKYCIRTEFTQQSITACMCVWSIMFLNSNNVCSYHYHTLALQDKTNYNIFPLMNKINDTAIVQDIYTPCHFASSICVCTQYKLIS